MSYFAINLLLAAIWMFLQGMSLGSLILGFLLGFAVLALSRPFVGSAGYVDAGLASVRLAAVFLKELVKANVRLARDVLRRTPRFQPALLRIDIGDLGPVQATLVSALLSLTPGTVTVDLTEERVLFVHTVYAHDAEQARGEVRRLAALVRRATGGAGTRAPGAPSPGA